MLFKVALVPSALAIALAAPARAEKHIEVHVPGVHVEVHKDAPPEKVIAPREVRFQLVRPSALIGQPIENAHGERLGRIQELAIDAPERRVAYAVVDYKVLAAADNL